MAKQGGAGDIDIKVFANREASFTTDAGSRKAAFDNTQDLQPSGRLQPQGGNSGGLLDAGDSSPTTGEDGDSWPILRFLLTLLVLAALMYFFFHR